MSCRSSPRARSLIPKLAASGWVAGWLAEASGGWLAVLSGEADGADEEDDSGCGWLAGWLAGSQTRNPLKRNL